MNTAHFRYLLVVYALSAGATIGIGLSEAGYSQSLVAAYAAEPEQQWMISPLLVLGLLVPLLVSTLAGFIGLFLFRQWGRSLSLWTTVAALVLIPFLGHTLTSPLEDFFAELASLAWGAALGLAYFSSIKARFTEHDLVRASASGGLTTQSRGTAIVPMSVPLFPALDLPETS